MIETRYAISGFFPSFPATKLIVAAFVAGVVISFLELACTGQVYAPTILFMLKSGGDRIGALSYLGIYNICFILPLLVIFGFAYIGLTSEKLTKLLQNNAAFVKFGTALLFLVIFVSLVINR